MGRQSLPCLSDITQSPCCPYTPRSYPHPSPASQPPVSHLPPPPAHDLLTGVPACAPTLVLPLLYVWIMFSAPCFTFSSMASCFSRPATRLRLVAEQAGPLSPENLGASGERGWDRVTRAPRSTCPGGLAQLRGSALCPARILPLGQVPKVQPLLPSQGTPSGLGWDQHEWAWASVQTCVSPWCSYDYGQKPIILVWSSWVWEWLYW